MRRFLSIFPVFWVVFWLAPVLQGMTTTQVGTPSASYAVQLLGLRGEKWANYDAQPPCIAQPATGFDTLAHLYDDTRIEVWLSRDPIGESGGLNLYGYAGGDPINNIDPNGRDFGTYASAFVSTLYQTGLSGAQTIAAGAFYAFGARYNSGAATAMGAQLFSDAMENSVSGQVLNNGGSEKLANLSAGIMGATFTTALLLPASFVGTGALLASYEAESLSSLEYFGLNGLLNSGVGVTSSAINQGMATHTINTKELEVSAGLGFGFGGLLAGSELLSNFIDANATQIAKQAGSITSSLDSTEAQVAAADATALQAAKGADLQTNLLTGADKFGSPVTEGAADIWLGGKVESGSSAESSSATNKGCGY